MFFDLVVSTKIGAKLLLILDIHKKSCTFAQKICAVFFISAWTSKLFGEGRRRVLS